MSNVSARFPEYRMTNVSNILGWVSPLPATPKGLGEWGAFIYGNGAKVNTIKYSLMVP